jgi:D-glycero-D-manno-heptose 1,7-bisphosphate phosphatase
MSQPAIFLDRDGTLMVDTGYVSDPALVVVLPGVPEALRSLKSAGFRLVIITNQSGIGRGLFTEADYLAVHHRFIELLGPGLIDAAYFCPDHPDVATLRRKPGPGMLLEAARDLSLDLDRSWMIGDRESDLLAGRAAGTRSILVRSGIGASAEARHAHFVAKDLAHAAQFILGESGAS